MKNSLATRRRARRVASLRDERGPAPAPALCVRVIRYRERALDHLLDVVHRRALQERQRDVVDDDPGAVAFEHPVVRLHPRRGVQGEAVLEPGAPAAVDGDAKQRRAVVVRRRTHASVSARSSRAVAAGVAPLGDGADSDANGAIEDDHARWEEEEEDENASPPTARRDGAETSRRDVDASAPRRTLPSAPIGRPPFLAGARRLRLDARRRPRRAKTPADSSSFRARAFAVATSSETRERCRPCLAESARRDLRRGARQRRAQWQTTGKRAMRGTTTFYCRTRASGVTSYSRRPSSILRFYSSSSPHSSRARTTPLPRRRASRAVLGSARVVA
eukprot:30656-Pelagococcus_subviridis.AAC.1